MAGGTFDFGANGTLGRVTLYNEGTATTWPELRVTGYLEGGFFITCIETGEQVRYERVIPAGSVVVINTRTGMATIDGASPGSGFITRRGFPSLPPKTVRTLQFNPIGNAGAGAQFTAVYRPAFA